MIKLYVRSVKRSGRVGAMAPRLVPHECRRVQLAGDIYSFGKLAISTACPHEQKHDGGQWPYSQLPIRQLSDSMPVLAATVATPLRKTKIHNIGSPHCDFHFGPERLPRQHVLVAAIALE